MPSKIYSLSQVLKQLRVFCFLLWPGVFTSFAFAQLPTATILGVVKDASGAVVPGAALTARNTETGLTRTTVSAGDGSYRFSALPVGSYEVRVEQSGFQTVVRSGLTLTVSQEAVVHFTLEVGAVTQTVAVTAEAPLVNTTSGSLGGLVSEQRVADLPLNGRNYVDLTLMQTGVSEQKSVNKSPAYVGTYFSSNGAPVRSNSYLLDGASMTNIWGASSSSGDHSTLGIDGIRELRVVTNSFTAEYGITMGSQMVMVSKGGTNIFHGSLFEYMRNSAMDARNFFDYKTVASQRRLPPFTRNNFGGSFGGPLQRDKTFFYGVFEGVRQRLGLTTIDTVPGAGCRGSGGTTITNAACPQLGAVSSVTVSPVIVPVLGEFPLPNLPNNQFTFPFTQPDTNNYGQMRADRNFSDKDSLFIRYTVQDTEILYPSPYPQFMTSGMSRNQFITLSENRIVSPTLLNTARVSFSRTNFFWAVADEPGHSGPQLALVPGLLMGTFSIGGITSIGHGPVTVAPRRHKQNLFAYSDDLFYTRGRHSMKFGILYNRYMQVLSNPNAVYGSASFTTLGNFLQGTAQTIGGLTPGSSIERTFTFNTLGAYVQDDWQVRSNFTLNLGLRYEYSTPVKEAHGAYAVIKDLRQASEYTVSADVWKNPSPKNYFSPRFGFAWDIRGDGKTALRGGFGLLLDILGPQSGTLTLQSMVATPPFSQRLQAANPPVFTIPLTFPATTASLAPRPTDWNIQQPHMLQYNLTVERQLPFDMALTLAYAGSRGINLIQSKEGNPTVPQGLPANGVCVARPAGQAYDINQPACWLVGSPRTNPNFGPMDLFTTGANSWYSALQFGLVKRLTKGLQFQSSYTWSRVIDENATSTFVENNNASHTVSSDPTHRNVDRSLAVFDTTQVWKFNTIYQIPQLSPSGGAAAKLLNGWWVSSILSLQSGSPFTPALQANRSRSGVNGGSAGIDRPDLVLGRNAGNVAVGSSAGCLGVPAGTPLGTRARYFDPCAFTIPAAGFLGTAGRNILRGPGFANLDFSLVKDTALGFLGESGKLQFRAEIFNILNRPNFGLPDRTVFAGTADVQAPFGTAGQITRSLGASRQIQLALKVIF